MPACPPLAVLQKLNTENPLWSCYSIQVYKMHLFKKRKIHRLGSSQIKVSDLGAQTRGQRLTRRSKGKKNSHLNLSHKHHSRRAPSHTSVHHTPTQTYRWQTQTERDETEIAQIKLGQNNSEVLRYACTHEFHYRRNSYWCTQSSM